MQGRAPAACDQRHGLLIVHRHTAERLADVAGGGHRVRFAIGPLGIHLEHKTKQNSQHGAGCEILTAEHRLYMVAYKTQYARSVSAWKKNKATLAQNAGARG